MTRISTGLDHQDDGLDHQAARDHAIQVSGVGRVFGGGRKGGGVIALDDVRLDVAAGEFVSLIGPSGCGKSTLLRIVADLDSPTSGSLTVFGKTTRQARIDQDYGIAFQQAGLLPWRTVAANVGLPLEVHGVARSDRQDRVAQLLDMVGLTDFARSYPDQLSGGMQQRVAIARALAESPRLLLMDEPFGALDEITRERMQTELVRICAETGAAVLFVTHSIPEAVFLSDRVVVMSPRPGRIVDIVDSRPVGGADSPTRGRDDEFRDAEEFFHTVARVRELLHAGPGGRPARAAAAARGLENR
jgi:NitT/TauT family transport system ATP-binding protein